MNTYGSAFGSDRKHNIDREGGGGTPSSGDSSSDICTSRAFALSSCTEGFCVWLKWTLDES